MFARHQVADHDVWRNVHDAFDRETLGVRTHAVYRSVEGPNDDTIWHDFDDRATAEPFMGSDDLRQAMIRVRAMSAPNLWLTKKA